MKRTIMILISCTFFITCSNLDLEEPTRGNPLDSNNPAYEPPRTEIISSFSNGATIDNPDVTFEWQGNYEDSHFRYQLDDRDWTHWRNYGKDNKKVTYPQLDEGNHTFRIQSRYPTGDEEDPPAELSFTVDAVTGPALMFRPRYLEQRYAFFSIDIMAEEINSVVGFNIFIEFNPEQLAFEELQVYNGNDQFLRSNNGNIIAITDYDNAGGSINLDLNIVGANPAGVSGTGAIGKIRFRVKKRGSTEIRFTQISEFRDENNQMIPIIERVKGTIINR